MKAGVNTGAIGRVTVDMPRHRKGKPRDVAPIDLAYYKGETEKDARTFAAIVNASYGGLVKREARRTAMPHEESLAAVTRDWQAARTEHADVTNGWTAEARRHETPEAWYASLQVGSSRMVWDDRSGIYALAEKFNLSRYGVPVRKPVQLSAKAARLVKPAKTKTTPVLRTRATVPAMAPAIEASDGGKAPCQRCGRSDWRTAAGRSWHVENNPECGKYRRPDRHQYAQA